MATLFIADLHLQIKRPEITASFLHFLKNEALSADALYILGDLFESWIGDDNLNPFNQKIISAIKTLVNSNVPCYFIHGNRDFLIGKQFAKRSGITLLPEEKILNLYGHRILIMHGDTLCTDDKKYQFFRKKVRISWIQKCFLSLPILVRLYISKKIRVKSKFLNRKKPLLSTAINQKKLIEVIQKNRVKYLIYGHTHCPGMHKLEINNHLSFCFVLGAWFNKGSMVKMTQKDIQLVHFPLSMRNFKN